MIPISSQVDKYKRIYNKKITKYHKCDTIVFGEVLGCEKAFLIQNMFPIIEKYIVSQYVDRNTSTPIRVSKDIEKRIKVKAKKVLALHRQGIDLIFPNVLTIEKEILLIND